MSLINIENITAGYTKESIIENISIEINNGELIGLLGSNGSGKSTLAKAICNLMQHTGNVTVDDKVLEKIKIPKKAALVSYIPQNSGISLDICVLDVVLMGVNSQLKLFEKPDSNMIENAKHIIKQIGLEDKIYSNYMLLSEGQKQLTLLARALINDSRFLVMDEPESALDFNVRYKMIRIIRNWIDSKKRAGLIILHDIMLALNSCDKLILLKDKHISSIIDMHNDSLEQIEEKLKAVYGDISLLKEKNKNGVDNYIVLFNSEAE